ncbi:carbonic anhydrase family protein [Saccharothrix xinjiangensis]|uniref:carbonic anhydrase n=1 Tax=Saccharothrix xinjiangensis TaxID=204798 RepID=A0ABV9XU31_9PSEU
MGEQQSPINIGRTVATPDLLDQLEIGWRPDRFTVQEGPEGLRFAPRGTHTAHLSDQVYRLVNLHFHRPSEHWVRGRPMQAEMHAVHLRVDDRLHACVVAVFLDLGDAPETGGAGEPPTWIDLPALLPEGGFHRYEGSLTTGEFTENVSWVVMREAVTVADEGLRAFVRSRADHARPVQPLNRRFVLTTG